MRITVLFACLCLLFACTQDNTIEIPTRVIFTTPTETLTAIPTETPTPSPEPTITQTFTPSRTPTSTFSPTPLPSQTLPPTASLTPAPTLGPQTFGNLAAEINQAGIVKTIADMQNFQTRHTNSMRNNNFSGIDAARLYLTSRLMTQAATCAVPAYYYEDAFLVTYQELTSTQTNFVLEITGTQGGNDVIVVGAHYDTISKEAHLNPYGFQPGADDNGSGVSAVLELARLYCLQPRAKTVVFVLFAAEEIRTAESEGRVGSRNFVSRFISLRGWRVNAMLNLDTIGSATDERGAIIDNLARIYSAGPIDGASRQLARQIQAAAYVQMPDFELIVEDREDRENRWGDHMSFTRAGYPAARLFEGSEDVSRQDTTEDLLNDLDPPYLIKNIQVTLAFLLGVSDGFPPPQNVSVNGRIVIWQAVPEAQSYLIAQRIQGESNYTFTILPADKTGIELEPNTIFAIGTIGSNGLLGSLTQEYLAVQ